LPEQVKPVIKFETNVQILHFCCELKIEKSSFWLIFVFFKLKVMFAIISVVYSTPQFFGRLFSSSSFVGSNGQVVSKSIYTDRNGNRIINGNNYALNQR
jgi:hypothetical protein